MLYHYDLSKKWTHVGKIRWKGLQCDSLFWRSYIQTVVLLCLLMCCNVRLVTFDNYSAYDTN